MACSSTISRVVVALCLTWFCLAVLLISTDQSWNGFVLPHIIQPLEGVMFGRSSKRREEPTLSFALVAIPLLLSFLVASLLTLGTAPTSWVRGPPKSTLRTALTKISTTMTKNVNTFSLCVLVMPLVVFFLASTVDVLGGLEKNGFRRSMVFLGNTSGYLAVIAMGIFMAPVVRINAVLETVGWTPTDSVRIHVWMGALAIIATAHHGLVYLIEWSLDDNGFWSQIIPPPSCFWKYDSPTHSPGRMPPDSHAGNSTSFNSTSLSHENAAIATPQHNFKSCTRLLRNFSGVVAGLAMILLGLASMNFIRRLSYRFFDLVHNLCTPIILFMTALHWDDAFLYLAPGLILWMSTTLPLYMESRWRGCVQIANVETILADRPLYSLTFNVSQRVLDLFYSGHYLQLRAPTISQLAHPFSVVPVLANQDSSSYSKLRIIFRAAGPFTTRLGNYITSEIKPVLQVEFPYGTALLPRVLLYEKVKIIAGGIGVTPFISLLHEFTSRSEETQTMLEFHWFCRDCKLLKYVLEEYNLISLIANSNKLAMHVYNTGSTVEALPSRLPNRFDEFQRHLPCPAPGTDTCPLEPSAVGSGLYFSDNVPRFLLLLLNSFLGLSITYYFYNHHQSRSDIWTRMWNPMLLSIQGLAFAILFVFGMGRNVSFLRWNWQHIPDEDPESFIVTPQSSLPSCDNSTELTTPVSNTTMSSEKGIDETATSAPSTFRIRQEIQYHAGRVPLEDILQDGETDAVFYCGPNVLHHSIQKAAPRIPLYKEEFEM